jgi:lysophospholipase L1-like esterase
MPRILCYGDSNTWGYATAPRPDDRYTDSERWPRVMAAELGPSWSVIEEGLNGRTTVHPDPVEGVWLDGSATFTPILRSHMPLDIVAIMLGTNDLKARFNASPFDIASGVGMLLKQLPRAQVGRNLGVPRMLVICPPPILTSFGAFEFFADMFAGGADKSLLLARWYEQVAIEQGAAFLNAGDTIATSPYDGIHLDVGEQAKLGRAVAAKVKAMAIA